MTDINKPRRLSIKARGLTSFESVMWLFTRLSALAMYALILFGLIGCLDVFLKSYPKSWDIRVCETWSNIT